MSRKIAGFQKWPQDRNFSECRTEVTVSKSAREMSGFQKATKNVRFLKSALGLQVFGIAGQLGACQEARLECRILESVARFADFQKSLQKCRFPTSLLESSVFKTHSRMPGGSENRIVGV